LCGRLTFGGKDLSTRPTRLPRTRQHLARSFRLWYEVKKPSQRSQRGTGSGTSQSDDRESDAQIYRSYAPELVRFANSLVGPADAQDVVSAAVLNCFSSKTWAQVENHRAYLYRAVLNEVRSQHRSTMRRQARELRAAPPDTTEMPEIRPDVLEALGQLSPRQRAVAYLTYIEDLDERIVGERLGISPGSVRQHLGRARRKLRSVLDE
jgi:RNA polymerase sigma factor (sigma-70 family)